MDSKESLSKNLKLTNFEIQELSDSNWIKPFQIKFKQNGSDRTWDGIHAHSSVACLIYNVDKQCIILVRQFRPVVYINKVIEYHSEVENVQVHKTEEFLNTLDWNKVDTSEGFTYELCAGLCDKKKSLEETCKEEVLEECGYKIDVKDIYKISQGRAGVGISGNLHTVFYTEVNETMKVSEGGGIAEEGEMIELFELKVNKIREFIYKENIHYPPGLQFALLWFLYEKDTFLKEKYNKI